MVSTWQYIYMRICLAPTHVTDQGLPIQQRRSNSCNSGAVSQSSAAECIQFTARCGLAFEQAFFWNPFNRSFISMLCVSFFNILAQALSRCHSSFVRFVLKASRRPKLGYAAKAASRMKFEQVVSWWLHSSPRDLPRNSSFYTQWPQLGRSRRARNPATSCRKSIFARSLDSNSSLWKEGQVVPPAIPPRLPERPVGARMQSGSPSSIAAHIDEISPLFQWYPQLISPQPTTASNSSQGAGIPRE